MGDKVLLSIANLPLDEVSKFRLIFVGPFSVPEVINPITIKLDLQDTYKLYPVIYVNYLRRYYTLTTPSQANPITPILMG